MKSKHVFVTFLYPGAEKYLNQFIHSLNNQTDNDFDIIVHNDGLKNIDFLFNKLKRPIKFFESGCKNLFDIRLQTFKRCKSEGYKYIIIGDPDDYFENNRISITKGFLKDYNLVVNDVTLINEFGQIKKEKIFSSRLDNYSSIKLKDIINYNFIGFTNSAFLVDLISDDFNISNKNVIAVDWLLFTILLSKKIKAIFTSDTVSFYRQHQNNIASLDSEVIINNKHIDNVRNLHYKAINDLRIINNPNEGYTNINKTKFWWEK